MEILVYRLNCKTFLTYLINQNILHVYPKYIAAYVVKTVHSLSKHVYLSVVL